jgi:hypothetical protein
MQKQTFTLTVLILFLSCALILSAPDTPETRRHEAERYLQATPPKALFEDMADKMAANLPPDQREQFKRLMANVAEPGAEKVVATIGKAGLRDAAMAAGVATDKLLALTGQMPSFQIVNIVMPTPEERVQRDAIHRRLDEITAMLHGHDSPQSREDAR